MSDHKQSADTRQARFARFRFSIVGPLLSAPPVGGELQKTVAALSEKQWKHPITGEPVYFSAATIERWFYQARLAEDPIKTLRTKRRRDTNQSRHLSGELKRVIQQQHKEHPSWSYQLHRDNVAVLVKQSPALGMMPSYSTIYRYMKTSGYCKQRNLRRHNTTGALLAAERLESREVRSFEVDHVHGLWHLDFHHGSRKILDKNGKWQKLLLLSIIDDHSRLICHAQWYFDETTESLVQGFMQALQKRGLPRSVMTDNGSAMIAAEFCEGLERLSILHQPILPYSPYQNAKQEVFWAQVEGRFMAMLENEPELTLPLLNEALIAWVEFEYHRKIHSELKSTPLECYLQDPNVGRHCPDTDILKSAFCTEVKRKQRRSDGTLTLDGHRFEVPSQYRHLEVLCVRYARWDYSRAMLMDPHSQKCLSLLYPQDKSANADGRRRTFDSGSPTTTATTTTQTNTISTGIAPLLKQLMADYAATGLPPAYIPQKDNQGEAK